MLSEQSRKIRRKTLAVTVLAALVFLASGVTARGVALVNVKDKVIVNNDKISLNKLAYIETDDPALQKDLETCIVGRSPLPGRSRQIDGDYLKVKLKQAGIDLTQVALKVPDTIEITRRSTTISVEELKTIARTFIETNAPYAQDRLSIKKIQVNQEVILPSGKISYQVKPPQHTDYVGNIPLAITFKCNGASVKKVWVMVSVAVMSDVIVAAKPLGRYQIITAEDIDIRTMDLARIPNNAMTSREDVLGQRAKRTIAAQAVLSTSMVEVPPLIRRGDIVEMIAESGSLKISTQGQARQKGAKGDRIKVMNLDSHKSVYGRVIDRNTVKVDF